MRDDFISIKEVIDSDGIGYVVDRYLHSEEIFDDKLTEMIDEIKPLLDNIEQYIKHRATEQMYD